jgi:hypothetical protein
MDKTDVPETNDKPTDTIEDNLTSESGIKGTCGSVKEQGESGVVQSCDSLAKAPLSTDKMDNESSPLTDNGQLSIDT